MPLLVYNIEENIIRKARINDYLEVVKALLQFIPYGKVSTYKSIAKALKINPKLVGKIMKLNDQPIIYPCYKIVKSNGEIGGYSGSGGAKFKEKIIRSEGIEIIKSGKISREYIIDILDLIS
ncbi:MAG: MGMT family protein [Candidatus Methanomethylicia archaeon]